MLGRGEIVVDKPGTSLDFFLLVVLRNEKAHHDQMTTSMDTYIVTK